MAVSTIAFQATSPSSICSGSHHISPHGSYDFDAHGGRSTPSAAASPLVGGLSRLFSSPQVRLTNYSSGVEELSSVRHDRMEELGSSFRYSSLKRDHSYQSPVSVLQGFSNSIGSRSSSTRTSADFGSMRHALGSGVDFDSSSLSLDDKNFDLSMDELTFDMEDNFQELDLPPYARVLLWNAQSRHSVFFDDFVMKAFFEAEKAHRGQKRASGDPYLRHCLETAVLLAEIGANSTVVAAGLLHDVVDDSFVTYANISRSFGSGVADLVEGVSKLSLLSKLARDSNTAYKTVEADRLHTMFLAMADARAVLIKLADRLHNMMTLDALPLIKQQRFAKETLEIFIPLANRLGVSSWKEKLENLCFKHLNPDRYRELMSKLAISFDDALITSASEKLDVALNSAQISYHSLSGRHKSLYSIHSKMVKKKLNMDEIHDIHGLRLIVETEEDCYQALCIVHELWPEVTGRFKDYIVNPKFNGYRSLHTVVTGEGMVPFEVQIRTKEMHWQAEYGFAAHWRYKEGDSVHGSFILQMVEWARWVITWQCEAMGKDSFLDSMKPPCSFPTHSKDCAFSCTHSRSDAPIFVILVENDKMSVHEFPANSTVMDLLQTAGRGSWRWSWYGIPSKEELRPRLNQKAITDPTCKLKMGDVVELTPAIPDKSLTQYREEMQRMYDKGVTPLSSSRN